MKTTHYVAREPDAQGHIHYPDAEHAVWQTLVERQLKLLDGRACQEYLDGLDQLALP
ncbi:MAG: phenylalanine 4-monooxygenase, partial [Pseudomonas sp.]|nr:phenylalanine 4-monooxygenase [Pseudomonas sp.]